MESTNKYAEEQCAATEVNARPKGIIVPADRPARSILIDTVLNGFLVTIGCKTVVFETKEKMLSELERYLSNPDKVEREYLERNIKKPA